MSVKFVFDRAEFIERITKKIVEDYGYDTADDSGLVEFNEIASRGLEELCGLAFDEWNLLTVEGTDREYLLCLYPLDTEALDVLVTVRDRTVHTFQVSTFTLEVRDFDSRLESRGPEQLAVVLENVIETATPLLLALEAMPR